MATPNQQNQTQKEKLLQFYATLRHELPTKYHVLLESESIQTYVNTTLVNKGRRIEPVSMKRNLICIWDFCDWLRKSPDEVVTDVRRSQASKKDPKKYELLLDKFFQDLLDRNSRSYSVTKLILVNAFLNRNHIKLDYQFPSRLEKEDANDDNEEIDKYKIAPKLDQLRLLYASTDDLDVRRFILFAAQTGLSEIDILQLNLYTENKTGRGKIQFDSIKQQYDFLKEKDLLEQEAISVVIPREKTTVRAMTFLGVECVNMLTLDYPDGRLFPWPPTGRDPGYAVRRKIKGLAEKIGLPWLHPHSFRKFFETQCKPVINDRDMMRLMMGHTIEGIEDSYWFPNSPDELRPRYDEAYPRLRFLTPSLLNRLKDITPEEIEKLPPDSYGKINVTRNHRPISGNRSNN